MLKKIWHVLEYIVLLVLFAAFAKSVYIGSMSYVLGGLVILSFWISMMLDSRLSKKNKVVSIVYWVSCSTIVILNLIALIYNCFNA